MPKLLPKSTRSRALVAGAVLLAVVLALGAVKAFGGSDDGPDVLPLPNGEKQPEPISFGDKPMWAASDIGIRKVAGVGLRGDTAIVVGRAGRLAAVDVRTGKPRWVVDEGSALWGGDGAIAHPGVRSSPENPGSVTGKPLVYGEGDDWTVLVRYTKGPENRETEIGVAALSGRDGSVRWTHPLVRPRPGDKGDADRKLTMRLLAADTRVVLASVEAERGANPKTVALDPATGRKLWEYEGGWAYRFAGDLVLGQEPDDQKPPDVDTTVFALDVENGQKRWDLGDTFLSAELDAVAGGTAVADVTPKDPSTPDERTVLLDTATGRTGAELDDVGECTDDDRTLIACSSSHGRLVTVRPGGKPFRTRKPPFGETTTAHVRMVRQDRIFVTTPLRDGRTRTAVVDRAANALGAAPSGEVVAVSRNAAAFRAADGGVAVYAAAVGSEPAAPDGPGAPTLQPPRIEAAPLWTAVVDHTPEPPAKDTGLQALFDIELVGNTIVYTGPERDHANTETQVVADAATGKVRWSITEGASLGGGAKVGKLGAVLDPHVVSAGGERLSLVRYQMSGGAEGVAALSLKDGRVRWKKQVEGGDDFTYLVAADDQAFAVRIAERGGDGEQTVVYATGTRKELWRERGVMPESIGGGLVLATAEEGGKPRDLIAYGVSDGERRWRLGDRYREPELLFDAGGTTIVVGTAEGGVVLDRATGRELARTPQLRRCEGDGDALIVCEADGRHRAVTIQTRDGATTVRDLPKTAPLERYGAVGTWFTAVTAGPGGKNPRFLLLDAAGRRISDDLPGTLRATGGGYAVLTPYKIVSLLKDNGAPSFTVHRLRG